MHDTSNANIEECDLDYDDILFDTMNQYSTKSGLKS